jgi:hypothetical protein
MQYENENGWLNVFRIKVGSLYRHQYWQNFLIILFEVAKNLNLKSFHETTGHKRFTAAKMVDFCPSPEELHGHFCADMVFTRPILSTVHEMCEIHTQGTRPRTGISSVLGGDHFETDWAISSTYVTNHNPRQMYRISGVVFECFIWWWDELRREDQSEVTDGRDCRTRRTTYS